MVRAMAGATRELVKEGEASCCCCCCCLNLDFAQEEEEEVAVAAPPPEGGIDLMKAAKENGPRGG